MDTPNSIALTPLTGRDTEVDLLRDRWEQAGEGMGQVVLIVGEAGLGKSRLVHTLRESVMEEAGAAAAADPFTSPVIEWRCSERFQSTGLFPFTDYLQRLFNFGEEESSSARFDRLAQYLEDCGLGRPETVGLFAKLLFLPPDERFPAAGLTPAREREETFAAVKAWLQACAKLRPILFVIEDLHWIDASSLELLGLFIADGLHDRILTVFTFRPEFRTPWPAVAHQTSLALNRLTRRQVAELMRKCAGGALPDALVAQIYQRTGGVPLLVEEFTRMARDSAIFDSARGDEMPTTLQQLVMARLDRMSSNREVAHFAATLGREFNYELLAAVVSVDEATLQAELAKLASAEILFSKGLPPRCEYLFKHALLEEALRTAPAEAQRRAFHRQVAEVMEAQFPQTGETQPELLALHFTAAGMVEKAAGYWLRAGRRSLERFANIEAIRQLGSGLDLLRTLGDSPARNAREMEILGPLGTAWIAAKGYAAPEVGPIFARARELSQDRGSTPQTFVMLRGHFAYHIVRGDFRLCTELATEAVELGDYLGDLGILMEAFFLEGLTHLYRGNFAACEKTCAQALAKFDDRIRTAFWAAQTGEDSGVAHRCYLALARWHLGFPDRALAMNAEARELARSIHHPFSLEYALHHTGWLYQHCRMGVETQAAGEEEIRIADEQGFLFWLASGTIYSGAGLLLRGRLEEGLRQFQKGLEAYRASGARLGLTYYLSILGEAFQQGGRFDEARKAYEEALSLVGQNDERFQEAELHRLQGELHLADTHDQVQAEACFQRAIEIAHEQGSRAWELRATMSLTRLWAEQGRKQEAFLVLGSIYDLFHEGRQTPDLMEAAALLKEWDNDRMRDDFASGVKYVRDTLPPPLEGGPVSVDWRYIPSSTLGGDAIGYHWIDDDHLALYLIDVTGHGLDSALLAVTITNVIRSGSVAGANMRRPDQVLAALNDSYQGAQHGYKFFTIWYGVYQITTRTLTYASGGHPSVVILQPGEPEPILLTSTGPVMGFSTGAEFGAEARVIAPASRLIIFSDGVFEIRRDYLPVWELEDCIAFMTLLAASDKSVMDPLLAQARTLRGSAQLEDDFSIIEARLH